MRRRTVKIAAYSLAAVMAASSMTVLNSIDAQAAGVQSYMPSAGICLTLGEGTSLSEINRYGERSADHKGALNLSLAELNQILKSGKRIAGRKNITDNSRIKANLLVAKTEEAPVIKKSAGLSTITLLEKTDMLTASSVSVADCLVLPAAGTLEEEVPVAEVQVAEAEKDTEDSVFMNSEQQSNDTLDAADKKDSVLLASAAGKMAGVGVIARAEEVLIDEEEIPASAKILEQQETEVAAVEASVSDNEVEKDEEPEEEKMEIETTQSAKAASFVVEAEKEARKTEEEKEFESLVIAQVDNYVNVRSIPDESGEKVGKLYDKSVGKFISEQDGWYEITSGTVRGFVKAEYCVTGKAAVELAKQVGVRIATVNTVTLKVRENPDIEAAVIGLVPIAEELQILDEADGWLKVNVEEGDGWISSEFVLQHTEFVQAESKAEEEARLAKEAAARKAAQEAAAKKAAKQAPAKEGKYNSASSYIAAGGGSASGNAVVQYAMQFVGNPYVYGGSSLTNGTDCSGFVMSVYANFGVGLPHSSAADRNVGYAVGSLAEAQPGDIVCYSGHVGIYAGGGQIVHASTKRTGIIVSSATYRNILSIRRIF